ncbi:hypothetical protein DZF91_11390 [Actinomadura logoneensis]|uniref:Uncharacterized protein n=1 Tax=Actinomadura logoneensis TaxID=2293572 RepID=A0A372JND1_9ACTN|nr:hypothetical protein DZF91_11390 [Actinomadura logoneensis]
MRHFMHAWRVATRTFTIMLMAFVVGLFLTVASLGRGDTKNTLTGLGIILFAVCGLGFLYFATSPRQCPYCARARAKAAQGTHNAPPMPGTAPPAYGQPPYGGPQPPPGGQPQPYTQPPSQSYGQPPYGQPPA